MVAITFSVPVGLPGTVIQMSAGANINTGIFNTALMPTAFGVPVKMVAGEVSAIEEDDTASVFWGILAAADVQAPATVYNDFGYPAPDPTQLASVMLSGYIIVRCAVGTPSKGGDVYMRIAPDTGKLVGDLETALVADETVLVPELKWNVNGKDATTGSTVVIVNQ